VEWIVPADHQWYLSLVSDKKNRAISPKAGLTRLTKIRDIPIAHKAHFLHFEEWNATSVDNFDFQGAPVSGCPYKLRCDYLALFAVGSLLGKAKEIDMEFSHANDVVRMLVQCTSVAHIPDGTDLSYDGKGYGINFEVEGGKPLPTGDIPMTEAKGDGDDFPPEEECREDMAKDDTDKANGGKEIREADKSNPRTTGSVSSVQHGNNITSVQVGSFLLTRSETKHSMVATKRIWGDRVYDDEGSLPSPLAHSAPPRFCMLLCFLPRQKFQRFSLPWQRWYLHRLQLVLLPWQRFTRILLP
jgi:hypothetical protein